MTKGSWSATDVSSEIVPANPYREKLIIQMNTSNPVAIGFGEAAVYSEGIRLRAIGNIIIIVGAYAKEAVYGICDTAATATGGYQENVGIA